MKWYLATPLLLSLAACGTPQQRCVAGVSHDMTVLDRLIAETQGNVTRGYAYKNNVIDMPTWVDCRRAPTEADPSPQPELCFDDVPTTVREPAAIDLAAEAAKLDSMRKRRAQMAVALQPAIADCQARYPE